jgi:hypothetical protein
MNARSKRFIGFIALVLGLLSLSLISSAWMNTAEAAGPGGGNGARGAGMNQTTPGTYQQGMGAGRGGAGVGMGAGRGGTGVGCDGTCDGTGAGQGRPGKGLYAPVSSGPLSEDFEAIQTGQHQIEYH